MEQDIRYISEYYWPGVHRVYCILSGTTHVPIVYMNNYTLVSGYWGHEYMLERLRRVLSLLYKGSVWE